MLPYRICFSVNGVHYTLRRSGLYTCGCHSGNIFTKLLSSTCFSIGFRVYFRSGCTYGKYLISSNHGVLLSYSLKSWIFAHTSEMNLQLSNCRICLFTHTFLFAHFIKERWLIKKRSGVLNHVLLELTMSTQHSFQKLFTFHFQS